LFVYLLSLLLLRLVAHAQQQTLCVKMLHQTACEAILKSAKEANRRLFLLDYDGTLVPFIRESSFAFPSTKVMEVSESYYFSVLVNFLKNMFIMGLFLFFVRY
jgi:hypothetical protein